MYLRKYLTVISLIIWFPVNICPELSLTKYLVFPFFPLYVNGSTRQCRKLKGRSERGANEEFEMKVNDCLRGVSIKSWMSQHKKVRMQTFSIKIKKYQSNIIITAVSEFPLWFMIPGRLSISYIYMIVVMCWSIYSVVSSSTNIVLWAGWLIISWGWLIIALNHQISAGAELGMNSILSKMDCIGDSPRPRAPDGSQCWCCGEQCIPYWIRFLTALVQDNGVIVFAVFSARHQALVLSHRESHDRQLATWGKACQNFQWFEPQLNRHVFLQSARFPQVAHLIVFSSDAGNAGLFIRSSSL